MRHICLAVLVLLCALAPSACQEEEFAALEAGAAESPAPPAEILCPAKVDGPSHLPS